MKSIKRGLAVLLAVLLMTPTLPAKVEAASVSSGDASDNGGVNTDTPVNEILFNTGNKNFRIVEPGVSDNIFGDGCFAEDGSYTINIPEENPFFPYEVQFTYNGEVSREWFMTPNDSVEIGGHTFYVSAYFDNTVMTQMTLDVAGQKLVVYPKEKEFTDDGDGTMVLSLLPLEERWLNVDLSAFTPVELTKVSIDSVFAGENAVEDTDKIIWKRAYNDMLDYTISAKGDKLDLSCGTCWGYSNTWEMIVGEADQLAADNIRYNVSVTTQNNSSWLIPTAYIQDDTKARTSVTVSSYGYRDYNDVSRKLDMQLSGSEVGETRTVYFGLSVNPALYASSSYSTIKAYAGQFATAEEAMAGPEITSQLFCTDMTQVDAGYAMDIYTNNWVTLVTLDANGNATGCLPLELYWNCSYSGISHYSLYKSVETEGGGYQRKYVTDYSSMKSVKTCRYYVHTLYKDYPADGFYYQQLNYQKDGVASPDSVTAAYVGQYASIAEAVAAGATDIKEDLFAMPGCATEGYGADYSQGVYITVFIGTDGSEEQEIYQYNFKTETGSKSSTSTSLNSGTNVTFSGLKDTDSVGISVYNIDYDMDSYAEFNYLIMFVASDVDLSRIAPLFTTSSGAKLYAAGGNTPEVSGESYHDFSQGPVQYTVAAEDGDASKNYWLQIVKAKDGEGQLYINSLADRDAKTKIDNGTIYSTREMMLDGYHSYLHDIILANVGTEPVANLSVELISDVVELDEYWTLTGNHDLSGLTNAAISSRELTNLARVRIKAKEGVESTDVSGTLTFKSGDKVLMVLTLTGVIGDPSITTKEIPKAVKYVPYGTMIQNNNKYSWNKVSYQYIDGILPEGMIIKGNGEIYGVPVESGEFTFTVRMDNSSYSFGSDVKTFTLTVMENTDANVEAATDAGYDLSQRVRNFAPDSTASQTLVSQGEYAEFVDVYIDGNKLMPGTDYSSEAGSTRITIMNQTLVQKGLSDVATHTLGIEFRTQDTEILKRAAQNFTIGDFQDSDNTSDGGSGNDSSGGNAINGLNGGVGVAFASGTTQTISYTIQSGDTLWKIAKKYYGNGENWRKIFEDNANVISNPNKIFVGQVIVIKILYSDITTTAITAISGNTYAVQSGDTLWKIAKKVYGKGWSWRKIYDANQSIISNPDNIRVGQVLVIPE